MDYLRTSQKSISTGLEFVRRYAQRLLVIWIISVHGCILRTYADIPNNDTLDYLRTKAST